MTDLPDDPTPGRNTPEFTVSEISGAVKKAVEGAFGRIRVRGEVGRVFRARSGHLYYDIKDDRNVLACTTWKGQAAGLSVAPEEGMEVIVTGRLTAFGAQSKYNLNVDEVAIAGAGALMAMLEKRKEALAAEGLFAPERKKAIPFLPEVIGVVTSPSGAVIRDILHRLRDRFPRRVLVWPVAVQGERCAPEVARAIEGFNRMLPGGALPRPDLLIVARGGGSIEDLRGFNEEVVARAAAASDIPLISAVGHETDTTLIDHVSDLRAPTPSAAAEHAVPVRMELLAWAGEQDARLTRAMEQGVSRRGQRLRDVSRALPRPRALVNEAGARLDRWGERLPSALILLTQKKRGQLTGIAAGLRPGLLTAQVSRKEEALKGVAGRLRPGALQQDLVRRSGDLRNILTRLSSAGASGLDGLAKKLDGLERLRQTLGYRATLRRGYAVVRTVVQTAGRTAGQTGGRLVTSKAEASKAPALEIEFHDGRVQTGGRAAPRRGSGKTPDAPGQGSLF